MEVGGEDGLRFTAPAGSHVLKPDGIEHASWNLGDEDVEYIELHNGPKFADVRTNPKRIPEPLLKNKLTGLASVRLGSESGDKD